MAVAEASGGLVARRDETGRTEETAVLEWVSHPIRHRHDKTVLLAGVVVLAMVGVLVATGSVYWAAASGVFLLLGVYDYLLPTHFRLDARGVLSRTWFFRRARPWSEVRSLHADRGGVLVSPFAAESRLDTFRGLYLRFDGNREAVMSFLRRHTGKAS